MRLYTILNKLATLVNQHTSQIDSLNSKYKELRITTGSLNDITEPGFYGTTNAVSDLPEGSAAYGRLIVLHFTGTGALQIFISNQSGYDGNIYFRKSTSAGAWLGWKKIASTSL